MKRSCLFIVMIVFIMGFQMLYGQTTHVSIPDTSADNGVLISIPVLVDNIAETDSIIAYQFILNFNSDILSPNGASSAGSLSAGWGPPIINMQEAGQVIVGSYGAHVISGNGALVFLKFTVTGTTLDTTSLKFSQFYLNNELQAHTLHNSLFTVSGDVANLTFQTNASAGVSMIFDGENELLPFETIIPVSTSHAIDVESPQQISPGVRYLFDSWSDGGERQHNITPATDEIITLNMNVQYELVVETDPAEVVTIEGAGWYDNQEQVQLSAPDSVLINNEKYNFGGWELNGENVVDNPLLVIMDKSNRVIAHYEKGYYITGTIHFNGNGLENAELILSGDKSDSTFSNNTGAYRFKDVVAGDYQITPVCKGFAFSPTSRSLLQLTGSKTAQDFSAADTMKPEISVTYPNGGEELHKSSLDTIRWLASDNDSIAFLNIHYSTNNGQSWKLIFGGTNQDGLLPWNVPAQMHDSVKIKITVADKSGNISSDMSDDYFKIGQETSVLEPELTSPAHFVLYQNYPNPFNNSTAISYSNAKDGLISLKIYNMQGQLIQTLVNQSQSPGTYQVSWDGTDRNGNIVGTGTYFIMLKGEQHSLSRRMIFLK